MGDVFMGQERMPLGDATIEIGMRKGVLGVVTLTVKGTRQPTII